MLARAFPLIVTWVLGAIVAVTAGPPSKLTPTKEAPSATPAMASPGIGDPPMATLALVAKPASDAEPDGPLPHIPRVPKPVLAPK
jgi:hypothetical protein